MKRFISSIILCCFCIGIAFNAVKKVPKGQKMEYRFEPAQSEHVNGWNEGSTFVLPTSRENSYSWALVDSSTNGYGLVAQNTRPLFVDVDEGNWYTSYRQYCGENTTHGQIGSAFSDSDGEDWTIYTNLNYNGNPPWGGGGVGGTGVGQGRYPSALGTEDQPLAIWNEYTGDTSTGSLYGGRPYYAYDEFGWDGGSFSYPADIDLLWDTASKDLWVGSVSISFNEDEEMYVVNAVYNDWTRGDRYLFHSEAYEDGFVIFGEEQLIIDEINDLVGGDDTGSFNTSPYVSCNRDGLCMVGLVGLFLGADADASDISNNHTGIFKLSDDHGASWYGGDCDAADGCAPSSDGDNYYFIPDSVWDDLVETQFSEGYQDECEGTDIALTDFWSYYEDDMKVDADGNPHFLIQVLPCDEGDEGFCYYTKEAGLYHFTADRNELGSASAWSWSFVMSGEGTWGFSDLTGETYIWNNSSSLAFSSEDTDVIYAVSNMATPGAPDENAPLDDPCYVSTIADFPQWSEDIYVVKSVDGGASWWNPMNATETPDETGGACPNGLPKCDPAETYPHTAQFGTDTDVYVMYQSPNWAFNEIGDLLGADFMNHVVIGTVTLEDEPEEEYLPEGWDGAGSGCYSDVGDISGDGIINVLDIVALVNHILGISLLDDTCAADFSGDTIVNVLDIVGLVNQILGIGRTSHIDATEANISIDDNQVVIASDGYIGGVDMIVAFEGTELVLEFGNNDVAEYVVNDDNTARIIIASASGIENAFKATSGVITSVEDVVLVTSNQGSYDELDDVNVEGTFAQAFKVGQAYPNPFNPTTQLSLVLDTRADISVKVYNIMGQLVDVIAEGSYSPNQYNWTWNAENLASGVYLVRTQVGSHVDTQKIMLMK